MSITGEKILGVRKLTKAELKKEGKQWNNSIVFGILLSNGTLIYPSMDYEGNGPGALFAQTKEGQIITITGR